MYYKDNKLVAFKDIPETAVILDKDFEVPEETVDQPVQESATVEPEALPVDTTCIACGKDGEHQRFINLTTVYLCREHYEGLTTGEVVQAMREKQEA
jgi:hypothetical protein